MGNPRFSLKALLVLALVGMLCAWGWAAERPTERTQERPAQQRPGMMQQRTEARQAMMLLRSSELIGKHVKNAQGEDLGNIYDLVLTPDYQQVSYLALSYGGIWGVGGKLFAVPWTAAQVGSQGEIILSISKDQLEQASGFNEDSWPARGDWRWTSTMRTGPTAERERSSLMDRPQRPGQTTGRDLPEQPGRTRQETMGTGRERETAELRDEAMEYGPTGRALDAKQRRVTNLTGMTVRNSQGEDIGNIEDFVIDTREGRLAYTIVSFGGFWGIGEKYAAVPFSAVQMQPRRNMARLDADRQTLEAIAFSPGAFPDLGDREYAQRLHSTFDAEPYWIVFGYVPAEEQQAAAEKIWGPQGEFGKHFDAQSIKTIKGTVQSVGTFLPEGGMAGVSEGLRLRIKAEDGNLITVYAGPHWFARQQNFYLKPGDEVTVTGSEAKIDWRSGIIATEIKMGDKTLQLRDQTGQPQWKWQPQGQQMPQRRQLGEPGQRQPGQRSQPQTEPQPQPQQ